MQHHRSERERDMISQVELVGALDLLCVPGVKTGLIVLDVIVVLA